MVYMLFTVEPLFSRTFGKGISMVQSLSQVRLFFLGCLFETKRNRPHTVVERLISMKFNKRPLLNFMRVRLRGNSMVQNLFVVELLLHSCMFALRLNFCALYWRMTG